MLCVSARLGVVALLGLQRPEQWEQLQWTVRPYLCDGGAIKAPDGGGYGARGAEAGTPAIASTIAAALGIDAAAAASSPLLATASCASDRCLLRFVICRVQALWKHKCVANDC